MRRGSRTEPGKGEDRSLAGGGTADGEQIKKEMKDCFEIGLAEDERLIVDKSNLFFRKPGVEPDEHYPKSILKV